MGANAGGLVERTIPATIQAKYDAWKKWASVWNSVHYIAGSGAAVAAALTAASIKLSPQIIDQRITLSLALAAAFFAFIETSIGPQKRATSFIKAYRHLEKAIAKYRYDPGAKDTDLGIAESEGIDLLE
jgi:hypothetical protein